MRRADPEKIQQIKKGQILEFLLWKHPCELEYNRTGLHVACWEGHLEVVKTLVHKMQECGEEQVHHVFLVQAKAGLTVLHMACGQGHTEIVMALLQALQQCDEAGIQRVLMVRLYNCGEYTYGDTALHEACRKGLTETVVAMLDFLEICTTDVIKQVLLSQNENGQTALDLAITGKHEAMVILISLLAVQDTATYTKLSYTFILSYTREKSDRNLFAEVDSKSWQVVLNHLLNRIELVGDEIARLVELVKQLDKEWKLDEKRKQEALLKVEKGKLKKYTSSVKYLPLVAAEKNKFGECLYDYDDLTSLLSDLLDICYKHNMDCSKTLSEMFPSFSFRVKQEVPQSNQTALNQEHVANKNGTNEGQQEEEDEDEDKEEKCTAGKKRHGKLLPFSKVAPIHPLTVIGEAGNLAIIKHPYIRAEVDACWSYFARYIFYLNLSLYSFFLFFMITFFTTHQIQPDHEDLELSSSVPVLTEISRYGTMLLALCGLIHEGMQISAKGWHYFKQVENIIDLVLFLCSIVVIVITLILKYDEHLHYTGCVLITIAGIRAAWMFTHVDILGIGHGFRMLFGVLLKVAKFSPILLFFILLFAVVFHNLLQNQEPFSHMGFSIMRIMAMSVGEIDFTDTFFDESNVHTFGIVAFLILVIFLAIMTISMMNLLIGLAVPGVDALSKQGEQENFKSKIDLILQYSYMMPWFSRVGKIQDRSLCDIYQYKWGKWQYPSDRENELEKNVADRSRDYDLRKKDRKELDKFDGEKKARKQNNDQILDKFKEYMIDIEKEYSQYRVSSDQNKEIEELKEQNEKMDKKIEQLSDFVAKQHKEIKEIKEQNEKQHEEMKELINKVILKK